MSASETINRELHKLIEQNPAVTQAWLSTFSERLFARLPASARTRLTPSTKLTITNRAFEQVLFTRNQPIMVRVTNEDYEGQSRGVIETLMPDCPFIVATIKEFLRELHLTIDLLLHPVLHIARDQRGQIQSLEQGRPDEKPESFVHVQLAAPLEASLIQDVADELKARLEEVLLVTSDFRLMTEKASQVGEEIGREQGLTEIHDLMRWLIDGGLIFLGYRRYDLTTHNGQKMLGVARGSGLGILRAEKLSRFWTPRPLDSFREATIKLLFDGVVPFVTKTRAKSNVHSRRSMDDFIIRRHNQQGEIVAFDRFLGLFTTKAHSEEVDKIPVVRQKVARLLAEEGVAAGSHDFETLLNLLNAFPKEELFRASVEELRAQLAFINDFREEEGLDLAYFGDDARGMLILLMVLASNRYSSELYQKIRELLAFRLKSQPVYDHVAALSDDEVARLHFSFLKLAEGEPDLSALKAEIKRLARTWEDRLDEELIARYGETRGRALAGKYRRAFSLDYQASTDVSRAAHDIERIESVLHNKALEVEISSPGERREPLSELRVYATGQPIALSELLPQLRNFGVRVLYEDAHEVHLQDGECVFLQVLAVQTEDGRPLEEAAGVSLLPDALVAVRKGLTEDDALNSLTLHAGLTWRDVALLRAYVTVALQMKLGPTWSSLRRVLVNYPELARILVSLFKARLDPERDASPDELAHLRSSFMKERERIETLAEDLIARNLLSLVEATVRTNYFRKPEEPYITLKFESARIGNLQGVVPLYEIHVVSPTMAGCHLRAGKIARGGIRFSDRVDDYRTEILDLMKTQTVKNAIIIPVGAKGGFVVKSRRRQSPEPREIAEAYQTLIGAMLDVTSNLVDGKLVAPEGVKVLDDDGPYLVVAADKGTATFSDLANRLARMRGFWLDDAFASGGEHGYDHKRLGITARGAWESVKRHFRELGRDLKHGAPITMVGIGDMSGDVFGNGLLQSDNVKLLAAFDARNIFLDPNPDPKLSYQERRRLFELPSSSWRDYNPKLISPGGGVYPRSHKAIPLSPEVRKALDIDAEVLDGEALIRAILRAPVDLLYNGGIGTYVRASDETDAEVGDHANDGCRITARELRAKVVVEGGNLGFTQKARVEYALRGGKINTDAIDNSAGVDMSDHEVNLKILLAPMVKRGELSFDERNEILRQITDDVVEHVLQDNRDQVLLLSLEEARSRSRITPFRELIEILERNEILQRQAEALPTHEELERRHTQGLGLTRPELAVIAAYTKLTLIRDLENSNFLLEEDEDYINERFLIPYFPPLIRSRFKPQIPTHQLRFPLIVTRVVNEMVNQMGSTFVFDLNRYYSGTVTQVTRAWVAASELLDTKKFFNEVHANPAQLSPEADIKGLLVLEQACRKACQWFLARDYHTLSFTRLLDRFTTAFRALLERFEDMLVSSERTRFETTYRELRRSGLNARLAHELSRLTFVDHLLNVIALAQELNSSIESAASAYFGLVKELDFCVLENNLATYTSDDLWEERAISELSKDLMAARCAITRATLTKSKDQNWSEGLHIAYANAQERLKDAKEILDKIRALPSLGLAHLQVGVKALNRLELN